MRIIGIDPGTHCGYAWSDDGKIHHELSGVWDLTPKRFEGGGMRFLRMSNQFETLIVGGPDECAVFFEEVRRHRGVSAAHIYGGIVAVITRICEQYMIPYEGIPVGTIKKFATGKGNASKEQMIDAANDKFSPHDRLITDDNQADALWILGAGMERIGKKR